jgi:spermidine/putrescine transport system permease protein
VSRSFRPELRFPPWVVLPALGWLLWFLLVPLGIVVIYSLCTKGIYGGVLYQLNPTNYARALDWVYLRIFFNSVKLASLTAFSCLVLGYPMAYVMATSSRAVRSLLLILVILPFWTNFVIRAYAIKVLFGDYGPMNRLLLTLGWIHEPIPFGNSDFSVWIGMVTNYLPFMVLPLFVALEKFDFSLLEAAKDLGASSFSTVKEVLFPLTRPGIITGCLFVFAPALGEFVIPDLLGGARTMLIGNLITEQFLKARDWPFGAALSILVIGLVMVSLGIYLRLEARGGNHGG